MNYDLGAYCKRYQKNINQFVLVSALSDDGNNFLTDVLTSTNHPLKMSILIDSTKKVRYTILNINKC